MIINDIGILGTGLWQGEVVDNHHFGPEYLARAQTKDPYKGRRTDDGKVQIAGLELDPAKHQRTIAAIERSFRDPFRGTERRRYFPATLKCSDAETEAARGAIADAGLHAEDIDIVTVQSFLSDNLQPKNEALIAHNLGIRHAPAWAIDSVCNTPVTQMHVAGALIHSGQARHVLCVQSVAYSRVLDMSATAAVQEGDMASAFVVGKVPGARVAFSWRTHGAHHGAIRFGWSAPSNAPARRWWEPAPERLVLHFDPELQQKAMGDLVDHARIVCAEALGRGELRLDEIDTFISHQPMSWYAALIEDTLGLRDGITFNTFAEYANINSSSIAASLHEARKAGRIRRGSKVLVFGPAAGYLYGAMAMCW